MTNTTIAVGILALAGLAVLILLIANANRGRRAIEDVPPGMRPAYSDEQLEKSVLERYMAWGLVMTLFFAVFFPVYWLREDNRLNAEQDSFFVEDVVRGEDEYVNLCAECHGAQGQGGAAPSPYGEGTWPAPAMIDIVARYSENPNLTDPVAMREFIEQTIQRGRPGTPMPTWGAAYGGPLTDQQIDGIVEWILANQVDEAEEAEPAVNVSGEELFTQNCAKCHGDDGEGRVETRAPSLNDVFDRHGEQTILGILQNGIKVPSHGPIMPPWQNGYMYPGTRYTDEALQRIIDYLAELGGVDLDAEEADEEEEPDDTETGDQVEVEIIEANAGHTAPARERA